MALRISYCPFRLLFIHPFATSHGVRTGTDSVFVRLEEKGQVGYGEATLPPYLKEKPANVIPTLRRVQAQRFTTLNELAHIFRDEAFFDPHEQGARAALHTAFLDLLGHVRQVAANEMLNSTYRKQCRTLVTLGITEPAEIPRKLLELPASNGLKIKMSNSQSLAYVEHIKALDQRPLFVDGNQGFGSAQEVLRLAAVIGDRLLGIEQPFQVGDLDQERILQAGSTAPVYGDESIQGPADLEGVVGRFGGVNIKLMKCGGLDVAKEMVDRASAQGLKVMLGSMSESSLGCTAMAHLAGEADIVDLDGPWLISNDPFEGLGMKNGDLVIPKRPGIGAVLKADLQFSPIGA